jgi:glutathione S-transferase
MQIMSLIGQMDSPFVRRVAVTMATYDIQFQLKPLSVYGDFDALRRINPLGTVPVLIDDAGTVHTDSEAICAWLDSRVAEPMARPSPGCLQLIGTANLLAQKTGELYRQHRWFLSGDGFVEMAERMRVQMQAGVNLIGAGLDERSSQGVSFGHADIAAVCAARFAQTIAAHIGLKWTIPPALETELTFREAQHGFRSNLAS